MRTTSKYCLLLFGLFAAVIACDDDKNDFSVTPAVGFGGTLGRVSESEAGGKLIPLYSNVKLSEPVTITMTVRDDDSTAYGTDYTTLPEPVNGVITVTVQPDEAPAFTVLPVKLDTSPDVRKVNFEITQVSGGSAPLANTPARYYELWITKDVRLVDHDFEDCNGSPVGFAEAIAAGTNVTTVNTWGCTTFGYPPATDPSKYTIGAEANAYGKGGTGATNTYLISNAVDAGEYTSLEIAMKVQSFHKGSGTLSVLYSENYSGSGDPEAAGVTWMQLPNKVTETGDPAVIDGKLPAAGSQTWAELTGVLTNTSGRHYYIAFQYKGGTTTSASDWRIDDFIVTGIK